MNTAPESNLLAPSPKRRLMLAGLGAGLGAAVIGALRWQTGESTTASASAEAGKAPTSPPSEALPPGDLVTQNTLVPAQLSREWFLPHLNTQFQVDDHAALRLTEISGATALHNGTVSYNAFTLLFEAKANCDTPEGIHRLRHAVLGEMDLFISPVGRHPERTLFEAAFTVRA